MLPSPVQTSSEALLCPQPCHLGPGHSYTLKYVGTQTAAIKPPPGSSSRPFGAPSSLVCWRGEIIPSRVGRNGLSGCPAIRDLEHKLRTEGRIKRRPPGPCAGQAANPDFGLTHRPCAVTLQYARPLRLTGGTVYCYPVRAAVGCSRYFYPSDSVINGNLCYLSILMFIMSNVVNGWDH